MTSSKKSLCIPHRLFLGICCLCQAFLNAEVVFGFVPRNPVVIAFSASRTVDHEDSRLHRTARPEGEGNLRMVGDAQGDYYGEASGSYMVKELSLIEELEQIVQLASQPIPERPDGIVVVVKYSSASRAECRATEAEYERFARGNPATIFMRCMEEFEDAHLLLEQVNVRSWPTTDIFYQGNRVARIEGPDLGELEKVLNMYQFMNSDLDLFSEDASQKRELQWGDGKAKDMTKTPRTTNRFIPAYDFDSDRGFFDAQGDKAQQSFEDTFGNWLPNIDDDDETSKGKK